jgi:hypothetical protein
MTITKKYVLPIAIMALMSVVFFVGITLFEYGWNYNKPKATITISPRIVVNPEYKKIEQTYKKSERIKPKVISKPVPKKETSVPMFGSVSLTSWKNWLMATAHSMVAYTLKKLVDLLFDWIKSKLSPKAQEE